MNEIWKDYLPTQGKYSISSEGRFKNNKTGKCLTISYTVHGTPHYKINYKGKGTSIYIARALYETFIGPIEPHSQIYQIDKSKPLNVNNIYSIFEADKASLIGKTFGQWKVISFHSYINEHTYWNCLCNCGRTGIINKHDLETSKNTRCEECRYPIKDLTNQEFGKWKVIEFSHMKEYIFKGKIKRRAVWKCQCGCDKHTIKDIESSSLIRGQSKSCGCIKKGPEKGSMKYDHVGKKFSKREIVRFSHMQGTIPNWEYRCECGYSGITNYSSIKRHKCPECSRQDLITHGDTKSKLYSIFRSMKGRCYNKKSEDYASYGARGITVYSEWLKPNGYIIFKEWALKNGYKEGLTTDRIDPRYGYEPWNIQYILNEENTVKRFKDGKRDKFQLKLDEMRYNRRKQNYLKLVKKGSAI